jgi:hypothetical protein
MLGHVKIKDDYHVMLNLSTESQGSIRSFKSSSCSRKNITYVPLNLWYDIVLDVQCKRAGPSLGGAGPNDVLCKTCNVLLCVLEQPRVDNSNAGLTGSNWSNWLKTGPVYNVFKFDRRVCMYLHSYLPKLSQDRRIVCGTRCTPFGFVQPPFS